ncbi:hypothetical protein ACFQZC_15165 [Streptacidiphilus monticola]
MSCCAVLLPGFERYQAGYAGWAAGLSTAAGGLLALQLAHLVPLLPGRVAGVAPTLLVVGTGPLLRVRRGRRTTVAFHAVPFPLLWAHGSVVARAGLRSRLAVLALGRVAVGLGVAELLLLSGHPFLWGVGRGMVLFTVIGLVLWAGGRKAGHLGWWPAPVWNRDEAGARALDPVGLATARALAGGDLERAHAELGDPAGTLTPLQLRVALAVAEGRCAEALRLATQGHGTEPDEELRLLAARAACHAVESGELSVDDAQPALRLLHAHGPRRLLRSSELPATRALLTGSPAEAVRPARRALSLPWT